MNPPPGARVATAVCTAWVISSRLPRARVTPLLMPPATAYIETLQRHHVAVSMAEVGAAWQNGYAERLIRTIKEEAVDLSEYRDYQDAYRQIGHFLEDVYMRKRIHSSLGYLTPTEFEEQWARSRQFHDLPGR